MFYLHSLSWPEITTLLAAVGLVVNTSVGFYMMKKSAREQVLRPLRISARCNPAKLKRHY